MSRNSLTGYFATAARKTEFIPFERGQDRKTTDTAQRNEFRFTKTAATKFVLRKLPYTRQGAP